MEDAALLAEFRAKGIDYGLSLELLRGYNDGSLGHHAMLKASGLPRIDGQRVVDLASSPTFGFDAEAAARAMDGLGLGPVLSRLGRRDRGGGLVLSPAELDYLGLCLLPLTAYGVLAGGGSTTYADRKRNQGFDPKLFAESRPIFDRLALASQGRPKGCLAAFVNPNGQAGPSFLRLKQRALLLAIQAWRDLRPSLAEWATIDAAGSGFPLRPFYMASSGNAQALEDHLLQAESDPLCASLIDQCGCRVDRFLSAKQGMISAFSHSSLGPVKGFFTQAYGKEGSALALPGGHGQCFRILKPILESLRAEGKRFAYISNVDNLGALPWPRALAYTALAGAAASFEFSFRSPVDVKGGILIRDMEGRLSCGDIGMAISAEDLAQAELGGSHALFNCATGLFNLDYLVPRLDSISRGLPVRFSDQDKDPGRYSQAEQNTWESISLLPDSLVFAVPKADRFLAAKMLMETIITSQASEGEDDQAKTSRALHDGLRRLLAGPYGLRLRDGAWAL